MIKTETRRCIIENDIQLSKEVQSALDEWNRIHTVKLELLFDCVTKRWQIYRLKQRALRRADDILHWQMSAPINGTLITPGIFTWLQKYDTSNNGLLDQDDMRKRWLEQWAILREKQKKIQENQRKEIAYSWKPIIEKISTLREQISVPIQVGWNKRTKKKVFAVRRHIIGK